MPFDDVLEKLTPLTPEERAAVQRRLAEMNKQTSSSSLYKGLKFEHPIPYNSSNKELFYFNASLRHIKQAGFSRHPRPAEAFSLICNGLEGKLQGTPLQEVYENMLDSYGEWLSLAVERRGDVLVAYVDPEGLVWKKDEYTKTNDFAFTEKKEFIVSGKPPGQWIDLKEFPEDFVTWTYSRKFADLPFQMREGDQRAKVILPPEGIVRPVGRGNFDGRFNLVDYFVRTSRGVRERA